MGGVGQRVAAAGRCLFRLPLVVALILRARPWGIAGASRPAQARWLQDVCGQLLGAMGCEVEVVGTPPRSGLLVSNHLSYLDVLVIGAITPAAFVAKADVRRWPLVGPLTAAAGTVYADRTRRLDVARVSEEVGTALGSGVPVVIFPEGTSSDGQRVLPFRSALLGVPAGVPLTPASLSYELEGGSAALEVCYWGDMTFFPHLLHLLGRNRIRARLVFGATRPGSGDRKRDTARLWEDIAAQL